MGMQIIKSFVRFKINILILTEKIENYTEINKFPVIYKRLMRLY